MVDYIKISFVTKNVAVLRWLQVRVCCHLIGSVDRRNMGHFYKEVQYQKSYVRWNFKIVDQVVLGNLFLPFYLLETSSGIYRKLTFGKVTYWTSTILPQRGGYKLLSAPYSYILKRLHLIYWASVRTSRPLDFCSLPDFA